MPSSSSYPVLLFILSFPLSFSYPVLSLTLILSSLFLFSCPLSNSYHVLSLPLILYSLYLLSCSLSTSYHVLSLPPILSCLFLLSCPLSSSYPVLSLPLILSSLPLILSSLPLIMFPMHLPLIFSPTSNPVLIDKKDQSECTVITGDAVEAQRTIETAVPGSNIATSYSSHLRSTSSPPSPRPNKYQLKKKYVYSIYYSNQQKVSRLSQLIIMIVGDNYNYYDDIITGWSRPSLGLLRKDVGACCCWCWCCCIYRAHICNYSRLTLQHSIAVIRIAICE